MEEDGIFFQLLIRKIQGGTRRDKEGQGGTISLGDFVTPFKKYFD